MNLSRLYPSGDSLFVTNSDTDHPTMTFKRRLASSPYNPQNNNAIAQLSFAGSNTAEAAAIIAKADANHTGANNAAGRLEFYTTADGDSSTSERMVIK